MDRPVVLCTDGSERGLAALRAGLGVFDDPGPVIITTVVEVADPSLVTGTGLAGGTMSVEEFDALDHVRRSDADAVLEATAKALGIEGARHEVIDGRPGPALVDFAANVDARALIIGSRGHGGFRRALLGSVSDHVVRHAHCPVIVVNDSE